tara:strand:+ start:114 stop:377 length:264 start_codon:yes stop_codon:yes gene_type:complete
MIKELKYIFYILTIFVFVFVIGKNYFSDQNIKKSYRSLDIVESKIDNYSKNLNILKNDTSNIIEYIENDESLKKKNYSFWKLITNED